MPKITMRHCNSPEYTTRAAIPSGEEGLKAKLLLGEQGIYGRQFQEKVHCNRLYGGDVSWSAVHFPVIYQLTM
jgi:hypothetical protein